MGVRKFTPKPWLLLHSQLPAIFFLVLQWLYLLGMVKNCNCLLSFQVEIESKSEVNLYSSVCSLWRSDIYEIPLSRPISPLIVQESAKLSSNNIEKIIILCKKKQIASIFKKFFRIYFVSAYEYSCARTFSSIPFVSSSWSCLMNQLIQRWYSF